MATKMTAPQGMIPRKLTFCNLLGGKRYELWHSPQVKPAYRLIFLDRGVEVNVHQYKTEVRARKMFERFVEEHTI